MEQVKQNIIEEYWLKKLSGEIPGQMLPLLEGNDGSDYIERQNRENKMQVEIPKNVTQHIKKVAKGSDTALFILVLTALKIALYRYTGVENQSIGTIPPKTNPSTGCILFCRTTISGSATLKQMITQTGAQVKEAFYYGQFNFSQLEERLIDKNQGMQYGLFDLAFIYDQIQQLQPELDRFALIITLREENEKQRLEVEYRGKETGYYREIIGNFCNSVVTQLDNLKMKLEKTVSELDITGEEEKKRILQDVNGPTADYPGEKTIHGLFEEQTKKTPQRIALVEAARNEKSYNHQMTYTQLQRQVNRKARHLREAGVKPGNIVAIVSERSCEMMAGIFGALKAGGAYLPIAPTTPGKRLEYILKDSAAKSLLMQDGLSIDINPEIGITVLPLEDDPDAGSYTGEENNQQTDHDSKNPAYLIYTSGSTGNPKGVLIQHKSVVNRLNWMQRAYPIGENDVLLQKTPTIFDVSVWELFWWSWQGSTLCLLGPGDEKEPEAIVSAIEKHNVTIIHFVPSMFSAFLEHAALQGQAQRLAALKRVFTSGEALQNHHVNKFFERIGEENGTELINLYGPTEATVDVSYYNVREGEKAGGIPIGKPIQNTRLYVLDQRLKLQPFGAAGELHITGDNLAVGYLNRPELTAERFVDIDIDGEQDTVKCYKTGDQVRLLPDGNIDFIGRIDHQVKIRGFRIELGEIESKIRDKDEIKDTVVMAAEEESGDQYLAAYIVTHAGLDITNSRLREYLADLLPDYMIPQHIIPLEKIPLTPTGKADRRALPAPETIVADDYAAPETPEQKRLLQIWAELLEIPIEKISIDQSFFIMGGHSVKAALLATRIQEAFEVEISMETIFKNSTIRGLSAYIDDYRNDSHRQESKVEPILPVEEKEYYPMSHLQKWLWVQCHIGEASVTYNMPYVHHIEGLMDEQVLKRVMETIVERHECLRSHLITIGGDPEPKQRILPPQKVGNVLQILDYRGMDNKKQLAEEQVAIESGTPFELTDSFLYRAKVIRLEDDDSLFLFTIHHIIGDAISVGVLHSEITELYDSFINGKENSLKPLTVQFKDYSQWLEKRLSGQLYEKEKEYWMSRMKPPVYKLELPADKPRPEELSYNGGKLNFRINPEKCSTIKKLAENTETTLFMVLLSIIEILFYRYTAQEDIVVGTSIAGRDQLELHDQIGFFVNTLPIRVRLDPTERFPDVLRKVKEVCIGLYSHQLYPLNDLVENLKIERQPNRYPLFDVMVEMNNFEQAHRGVKQESITIRPVETAYEKSKYDLTIYINEGKTVVDIAIEYMTDLFEDETIRHMKRRLQEIIDAVIENPAMAVAEFSPIQSSALPPLESRSTEYPRREASFHQQRLWFIDQFEAGNIYESNPVYHNIPLILEFKGPQDREKLEKSIQAVIRRHDALRTRIVTENNRPWQELNDTGEFQLGYLDMNKENGHAGTEDYITCAIEETRMPLNPENDQLIRGTLMKLEDNRYFLVLTLHHIIADSYSLEILANEILAFYNAALFGTGNLPKEIDEPLQYSDFSQWQQQVLKHGFEDHRFYWKWKLNGKISALELFTDRPRAQVHIYREGWVNFELEGELDRQIRDYCRREAEEPLTVLLAIFKILLHRTSTQEEIVVGTTARNRTQPGTEEIVGPLANLLVLRSKIDGDRNFLDITTAMRKTVEDAFTFQDLPFDKLVEELNPQKDMSRTALFDVLFRYEEQPVKLPKQENGQVVWKETNLGWGKYDLNMLIRNEQDRYSGILVYNADYYNPETIKRYIRHYKVMIKRLLEDPRQSISRLLYLTESEKHQLLEEWNKTEAQYPTHATIQHLFEEQAAAAPQMTALVYGENSWTYERLNREVNRLAHYLKREYAIQHNEPVCISLERSPEMIAGLLGILKAGGAYVPIDPHYPRQRIDYILGDSRSRILICDGTADISGETFKGTELNIKTIPEEQNEKYQLNPGIENDPGDTAYIIYTSGTTGKPKGCMVSHRNVVRLMKNDKNPFHFTPKDTWIMAHSFCFDFSVWEMYGALLYGGRLIIPERDDVRDVARFLSIIKRHRVTVLNQTPPAFYALTREVDGHNENGLDDHLRMVIFGGDKLEPVYLAQWVDRYPLERVQLVNMYGITETTVHVTYYFLENNDVRPSQNELVKRQSSPIGQPLPETTIYVFNRELSPEPVGVAGELYVGGSGVSKGYLNNEGLTEERFIENPLKQGEKLYKTGDLGRRMPDGSIDFLGRIDHQVKIRGFRIELGEIESRLLQHNQIKEAVVTALDNKRPESDRYRDDKYLCAYYVSANPLEEADLKQHLAVNLPDYMIPLQYVHLDAIPMTANGKVDRSALPEPGYRKGSGTYCGPRDLIEKTLVAIWADVLSLEEQNIGIDDNFFSMGGHSLKAAALVSGIHKALDIKIPLAEVFQTPTVREMSETIKNTVQHRFAPVENIEDREYYPLSPAQRRLFILYRLDTENIAYNVPNVVILEGKVREDRLIYAFQQLIHRHESLRTSFEIYRQEPVQRIHAAEDVQFELETYDNTKGETETEAVIREFIRPFDLSRQPQIRAALIKENHRRHVLAVDLHHIVADGASMERLMKEFTQLYGGGHLPPMKIRFKDYTAWQASEDREDDRKKQMEFWKKRLGGQLPVLNIPTDFERPPVQQFNGDNIGFEINEGLTTAVRELMAQTGTTLYMVMLSAFYILLARYADQEDIIVGTPIKGRSHPDLENIVGMFINVLAMRNYPYAEKRYIDFLEEVKENTLQAFDNQDCQFDQLVEQLNLQRDKSRNPVYDAVFAMQDAEEQPVEIPGLKIEPYPLKGNTSKTDLRMGVTDYKRTLWVLLTYSTALFKRETANKMTQRYREILEQVLEDPHQKIKDIQVTHRFKIIETTTLRSSEEDSGFNF